MKIFIRMLLILLVAINSYAESSSFQEEEPGIKFGMSEGDFTEKLEYFKNAISNFEKIVKNADKGIAKAEIEVSSLYVEEESFFSKIISWLTGKKTNNPLKSLPPEEQMVCKSLIAEVLKKAKESKSVMLSLRETIKYLKEKIKVAEKLKRDLHTKYDHPTREELNRISTELKKKYENLKQKFIKAEKTFQDLQNEVTAITKQTQRIRGRLRSIK